MAGLSDTQVKKAKPTDAAYRMADSGGLFVFITPAGGKLWRLRYRYDGKEKTLSLGSYPEVSLLDARRARDAAKEMLKSGRDPSLQKKLDKLVGKREAAETFEAIAREWHALQKPRWTRQHAWEVNWSLEKTCSPRSGPCLSAKSMRRWCSPCSGSSRSVMRRTLRGGYGNACRPYLSMRSRLAAGRMIRRPP